MSRSEPYSGTSRANVKFMPRLSAHRVFLLVSLGFACSWVVSATMLWKQQRSDREFDREVLQPQLERLGRGETGLNKEGSDALREVAGAELDWLNESMERRRLQNRYWGFREGSFFGLIATGLVWIIFSQVQFALRRRAHDAAERPAAKNAGYLLGELIEQDKTFTARENSDTRGISVQVDGGRGLVIFRNVRFIAAFVGNKRQDIVELPLTDILALSTGFHKGRAYLNLRTTAGRLTLHDSVQPFRTLADLLDDIIELNRTDPSGYRDARAREPVVKTPWYGWLIIAAAMTAVVWVFKLVVS